jgi:hypothetical protein
MAKQRHERGPPMDLANMRRQGVRNLIAYCLNDACRHQAIIDVSSYPGDIEVPWLAARSCAPNAARAAGASTCGRTGKRRRDRWTTGTQIQQCPPATSDALA